MQKHKNIIIIINMGNHNTIIFDFLKFSYMFVLSGSGKMLKCLQHWRPPRHQLENRYNLN